MNNMSKGIATETILYLLVGILVVGILVYLIYKYAISKPMSETDCRNLAVSWCTSCKIVNFGADGTNFGPAAPAELQTCVSAHWPTSALTKYENCKEANGVVTFCKNIAGIS